MDGLCVEQIGGEKNFFLALPSVNVQHVSLEHHRPRNDRYFHSSAKKPVRFISSAKLLS
jgi:hypothetical protein